MHYKFQHLHPPPESFLTINILKPKKSVLHENHIFCFERANSTGVWGLTISSWENVFLCLIRAWKGFRGKKPDLAGAKVTTWALCPGASPGFLVVRPWSVSSSAGNRWQVPDPVKWGSWCQGFLWGQAACRVLPPHPPEGSEKGGTRT